MINFGLTLVLRKMVKLSMMVELSMTAILMEQSVSCSSNKKNKFELGSPSCVVSMRMDKQCNRVDQTIVVFLPDLSCFNRNKELAS